MDIKSIFEEYVNSKLAESMKEVCEINLKTTEKCCETHIDGDGLCTIVTLVGTLKELCKDYDIDKEMLDVIWNGISGVKTDLNK